MNEKNMGLRLTQKEIVLLPNVVITRWHFDKSTKTVVFVGYREKAVDFAEAELV